MFIHLQKLPLVLECSINSKLTQFNGSMFAVTYLFTGPSKKAPMMETTVAI